MCGIVGFVNKQPKKTKEKIIKEMSDRIIHRGPNSDGFYCDEDTAIGFRRLSIIDLAGGTQPIYNEKEDKLVFFNGEIYNFKELRKELEKKGHVFKTNTDTEVILHGFEEYGEDIVDRLRGMFTFVIWDLETKEMFGARDPFGVKPFYYAQMNDTFMFGSEIKSFLAHPKFDKQMNEDALRPYLTFQFSSMEETFFKGVKKLKPGHCFTYKNGNLETRKYFTINLTNGPLTEEEYKTKIKKVMKDSVDYHSVSDVKVGSFLSGGVDSSYIAKLLMPDNTFSVGFERKNFSEISQAKELSDILGIENINRIITPDDYFGDLGKCMYFSDEPHASPSSIAIYFLSKMAKEHVTVALSGEGADELFGGNDGYMITKKDLNYRKIPKFIRRAIGKYALDKAWFHGRRFLVKNGLEPEEYYTGPAFLFGEEEKNLVLQEKYLHGKTWKEIIKPIYDEVKGCDEVTKLKYLDFNLWLPEDLLLKADKMTMAHSIELRVPFLDREVMNLAQTIPSDMQVRTGVTKHILRECANDELPEEWAKRPKWGFPVPFHYWIREDKWYNVVKEAFNQDYVGEFFHVDYLNKLLDDHKNEVKQNGRKIYVIYTFLLWYNEFFIKEN